MEKQENQNVVNCCNGFDDILVKDPIVKDENIDICDGFVEQCPLVIKSDNCGTSSVSEEENVMYCNVDCNFKNENAGDTLCQNPLPLMEQNKKKFTKPGEKIFKTSTNDRNRTSNQMKDLRIVLERIDVSWLIPPVINTENAASIASHSSNTKNGDAGDESSCANIISLPNCKRRRTGQGACIGQKKDEVLAEYGDPVFQGDTCNMHPLHSKNEDHSKSRKLSLVGGSCQQEVVSQASDVLSAPEGEVNRHGKWKTTDKRNQKTPISRKVAKKSHEDRCSVVGKLPTCVTTKEFECAHCGFRCARKSDLERHIRIHSGDKPFQCSYCGNRFSRKSNLNVHMLAHSGDKPFQCSICEYRFSQKGYLKRHMLTHSDDKPFQCSSCEYRCFSKGSLKKHMMIHSGDKPFQCSYCEFKCTQKYTLTGHLMTHSGDKPFQCFLCEFKSTQKSGLTRHLMTHSGDKPFQCFLCEYRCSRKQNLNYHIMTHTGSKPFRCSYCNYGSTMKGNLRRHMLTHPADKRIECFEREYLCSEEKPKTHILTDTVFKLIHCPQCEYQCIRMQDLMTHVNIHK